MYVSFQNKYGKGEKEKKRKNRKDRINVIA
jgi:hypothetical protein